MCACARSLGLARRSLKNLEKCHFRKCLRRSLLVLGLFWLILVHFGSFWLLSSRALSPRPCKAAPPAGLFLCVLNYYSFGRGTPWGFVRSTVTGGNRTKTAQNAPQRPKKAKAVQSAQDERFYFLMLSPDPGQHHLAGGPAPGSAPPGRRPEYRQPPTKPREKQGPADPTPSLGPLGVAHQ